MAFQYSDLTYEKILHSLGGSELLELMIGAYKIKHLSKKDKKARNPRGLSFKFKGKFHGENKRKVYEANFVPSPISNPDGVIYYHLMISVTNGKYGFVMPHCGIHYVDSWDKVIPSFEKITNLTLTFAPACE